MSPFARLLLVICTKGLYTNPKEGHWEHNFGKEGNMEGREGKVQVVNLYINSNIYIYI